MFAAAGPGVCIRLGSPGLDLGTMVLSQELTEDPAPLCMTLVPIFAMALMGRVCSYDYRVQTSFLRVLGGPNPAVLRAYT